ncbi:hypothetical protein [Pseudomonas brassicacearum]|uniref:hypothetical protein n=1 Tax=Pseudomonas brassicacearum TaxID=930166 RepID=UPI000721FFC4|nr:hypothetical protein [Pseudomonas brassicacearum]ALQ01494.1 hypothetical protein AK973_1045 [Pseudomonas brassicacearum]
MPSTMISRIDGLTTSVAVKPPIKIMTSSPITLVGEQVINAITPDGSSVSHTALDGERIGVNGQADKKQNGIYVCRTTAWERAKDFDGSLDAVFGTLVTDSIPLIWRLVTPIPVLFGTSDIEFETEDGFNQGNLLDLANHIDPSKGTGMVGDSRYGNTLRETLAKLPYYASLAGLGQGGNDTVALQAMINIISLAGGGEIVMDCNADYRVSDSIYVKSNVTMTFTGSGYIKAIQNTSNGAVLVVFSGDVLAGGRVYDVVLNNPRVDGNNIGWPASLAAGENGIAGTNCERVRVWGGHVKNCRRGTSSATGSGGKGIQFESGVADIKVIATEVDDCSISCETGGVPNILSGSVVTQYRAGIDVEYDIVAKRCGRVVSLMHGFTPPALATTVNCKIKVIAINCGREDVAGTELDFGALVWDRYGNAKVDITLINDENYGPIYATMRGRRGVDNDFHVRFIGECEYIVSHNSTFNSLGTLSGNIFTAEHRGTCNQYAIGGPSGESAASLNNIWDISPDVVTGGLVQSTWQYTQFNAVFTSQNGVVLEGDLSAIGGTVFGNAFPASTVHAAFAGTLRFNGLTVSYGAGVQIFDSTDDTDFRFGGVSKLRIKTNGVVMGVPTYADNATAIAGGLGAGAAYKTAAGDLRIVV